MMWHDQYCVSGEPGGSSTGGFGMICHQYCVSGEPGGSSAGGFAD